MNKKNIYKFLAFIILTQSIISSDATKEKKIANSNSSPITFLQNLKDEFHLAAKHILYTIKHSFKNVSSIHTIKK